MKRNYKDAYLFPWPNLDNFIHEIELSHKIEEWCKKNFNEYFTAGVAGLYIYDEGDVLAFKLRWESVYNFPLVPITEGRFK